MGQILFILRETGAAAVVLVPMFFVLDKLVLRDRKRAAKYALFSCYLAAVWALVGLPNVTYVRFELKGNLIPFAGMGADLKNCLLNVVLFVPLGFGLPLLWKKYRAGKRTVLFGLLMSLAIEALQVFTYRATDVNDVITNTLGTALGYLPARLLPLPEGEEETGGLRLTAGVTAAVMFFVHPFLSELAWRLFGG